MGCRRSRARALGPTHPRVACRHIRPVPVVRSRTSFRVWQIEGFRLKGETAGRRSAHDGRRSGRVHQKRTGSLTHLLVGPLVDACEAAYDEVPDKCCHPDLVMRLRASLRAVSCADIMGIISSVPGGGVRDSGAWQDKGHRVTLINDKDEGGERDGQGQDGRAGAVAQGGA